MEKRFYDAVIVGGGASGLAAAVELRMSSSDFSVLVIEKMKEPGRKIRATGSGRCNITNTKATGYDRITEFFNQIGLAMKSYENGLVYPYSESASDVADLLTARAITLGVKIACSEEVISIKKEEGEDEAFAHFSIESKYKDEDGEHTICTEARYVVLATGGKAGPSYGTTGDGYRFAKELGHSIVTPVPALTGIECMEWDEYAEPDAHILAGTRTHAVVSLYKQDGNLPCYEGPFFNGEYVNCEPVFRESGEVQFTKYGLSGICIFNMTRHMRFDKTSGEGLEDYFIKINLLPGASIAEYIFERQEGAFSSLSLENFFCTIMKKPVAEYVKQSIDFTESCMFGGSSICEKPIAELTVSDIALVSDIIHGLEFYPDKIRGWQDAQVTMGGVKLDEIDEKSCESKLVKGLYITGELADRDFECGGFNLSNAWVTGLAAADDIAKK